MKILPRWFAPAFTGEIRKIFSYRVDFWVGFLGSLIAHLGVAYFLWRSIFEARGVTQMEGYSFSALMFYYLLVPTVDRVVRGLEMSFIAPEIYDGSLSRYLVYPYSFYGYKFTAQLALACVSALQLLLSLGLFLLIFGAPNGLTITLPHVCLGLLAAFSASYLYFAMGSCLELVAFWADNVWSLVVMLRFAISFLGGGFVPLVFFPDTFQRILEHLPFPYLLSFPIRTFLGQLDLSGWASGLLHVAIWSLAFTLLSQAIWRRGIRQYSGVGI